MEEHRDLPERVPLCVPYARRSEASAAGARFDREEKAWFCSAAAITSPDLQQFLPFRFRRDRPGPYIRPWMVPQPLWGLNLRAMLEREDWNTIRKAAYERSGYRCRVCGGKGPQWPVEADEGWKYKDTERVQVLWGCRCPLPRLPCGASLGKIADRGTRGPGGRVDGSDQRLDDRAGSTMRR